MPDNDARDKPDDSSRDERETRPVSDYELDRERAQAKRDAEQDKRAKGRETVTFWVAVAGVFIAAVGAVVSYMQFQIMQEQLRDARAAAKGQDLAITRALEAFEKQATAMTDSVGPATKEQAEASTSAAVAMKDAAEANKNAADSARRSAENSARLAGASERGLQATRDSLRLDQRAWVGFKGVSNITIQPGSAGSVTLVFINTGRTPAVNAQIRGQMSYVPPTPSGNVVTTNSVDEESITVIHPNQEGSITPQIFGWTEGMSEAVALRTGNLYVRARVTYDDIFGESHVTEYCGVVSRDLLSIGACATGNSAN